MNILIIGSSTILGSACIEHFFSDQHTLFIMDSLPTVKDDIRNQLDTKTKGSNVDILIITETEAIIEGAQSSFSLRKKQQQFLQKITHLFDILNDIKNDLQTIILVSSIQIYAAQEILNKKSSTIGKPSPVNTDSFYQRFEQLTSVFNRHKVRLLYLRLGKIISRKIEPIEVKIPYTQKLLPIIMGGSREKINWISQEDAIAAISFLLDNQHISGAVNLTSGDLIESSEYYSLIAQKYELTKFLPLPKQILKLLLGSELCMHLIMHSQATPVKLMQAGFLFKDISLAEYLEGRSID